MSYVQLATPIQRVERTTQNRVAYNYYGIQSAFAPQAEWLYENIRNPLSGMFRRIDDLSRPDNQDRATLPNIRSVVQATRWIHRMYENVRLLGKSWVDPLVTVDEFGDIVFEWWHKGRKITVYVTPELVEYIKVSGPDMHSDMEDGELRTRQDHQDLWNWLTSGD